MFGTICSQGMKGWTNVNIQRVTDLSVADLCLAAARNILTSNIIILSFF